MTLSLAQILGGLVTAVGIVSALFFLTIGAIAVPLNLRAGMLDAPRKLAGNTLKRYFRTRFWRFHLGVFLALYAGIIANYAYIFFFHRAP